MHLLATARISLRGTEGYSTPNVHVYSDCRLFTDDLRGNELPTTDNNGDLLADTRTRCRWLAMTFTFSPTNVVVQGNLITAANLSADSTIQIYLRAPQAANGGLHAAITRDMILNNPGQILLLNPGIVIHAMDRRNTALPSQDAFNQWILNERAHVDFEATGQIATRMYVGVIQPVDDLPNRINRISQRKYDPSVGKYKFLNVSETFQELTTILREAENLSDADYMNTVPELDKVLYNGLVRRLQDEPSLATKINHTRSTTPAENNSNLQAFVDEAIAVETRMNTLSNTIRLVTGTNRRPYGTNSSSTNPASTFMTSADLKESAVVQASLGSLAPSVLNNKVVKT